MFLPVLLFHTLSLLLTSLNMCQKQNILFDTFKESGVAAETPVS